MKYRIWALIIVVLAAVLSWAIFSKEEPFKLGLDLAGGTELVFQADVSDISPSDVDGAMQSLRDVIERRVNVFGVSEPIVHTEVADLSGDRRLVVELPGVTDVNEAVEMIGRTPQLEFRLQNDGIESFDENTPLDELYLPVGLGGKQVKKAQVVFNNQTGEPIVSLEFNNEGKELFASITAEHIGDPLAIFLDGELISAPVIREKIPSGQAQISGNFDIEEAQTLSRDLNLGALPVPIELASVQTVGPTLGAQVLDAGVKAVLIGLVLVALFMVFWYRLPGFLAVTALAVYTVVMLGLFAFIPVTLTAAGIAGFILSVGMAVDANVLIFERFKEEFHSGKNAEESVRVGFTRAWASIRDANISSIITAIILFWLGTSIVKGFALVFGLGVIISMLSAILVTRVFFLAIVSEKISKKAFGSGLKKF